MAMIAPEPDGKGGRSKTAKILAVYEGSERNVMKEAIRKARLVLRVTPAVADRVLAGTLALDAAYKTADAESKRDQIERDADARLERQASDLYPATDAAN